MVRSSRGDGEPPRFAWCVLVLSSCAQIAGISGSCGIARLVRAQAGAPCVVANDCLSCACGSDERCREANGLCLDGTPCHVGEACASGRCTDGPCAMTCTDGVKDGAEGPMSTAAAPARPAPTDHHATWEKIASCARSAWPASAKEDWSTTCTADDHCASGFFCVNGVCCGQACSDQGAPSCGTTTVTAARRRLLESATLWAPPCGEDTCTAGTSNARRCDGMGTCGAPSSVSQLPAANCGRRRPVLPRAARWTATV